MSVKNNKTPSIDDAKQRAFYTEGFVRAFHIAGCNEGNDSGNKVENVEIDSVSPFKIETQRGTEILFVPDYSDISDAKLCKNDVAFNCSIDATVLLSLKQSHTKVRFFCVLEEEKAISKIQVI